MILYFGDPNGALYLLEEGLRLSGVVHGRRGGNGWPRLLAALKRDGTPRWMLPDLDDAAVVAELAALRPALIVSSFYPRRIPASILALAPGVNVHPSDLPRWRGPDPTFWTIRAGDAQTAICVHRLTEGLDEGPILQRWPVPVKPGETSGHLAERLERKGARCVAEVAARLLAGGKLDEEALVGTPQAGEITWAPQVPDDDLEIDWTMSATEVDQLVRAAAPDPGAFTGLEEELMVVFSGKPVDAGAFEDLAPGSMFIFEERAHLRCGQGAYALHRIRVGRRAMTGKKLAELMV